MILKEDFLKLAKLECEIRFGDLPSPISSGFKAGADWAFEVVLAEYKNHRKILTERQGEYLDLIVQGYTNKEIAEKLFVTEKASKWMCTQLFRTYKVANRHQLALKVLGVCIEDFIG